MKVIIIPFERIIVETLMDPPIFVNENDNILIVIKKLLEARKGYVLVQRIDDCVGIISDRDIQRLILKEGGMFSPTIQAKDFMVQPVIKAEKTTTLREAESIMRQKKINRLPIVERKGSKKVIGVINYDTLHSNLLTNFAKSWTKRVLDH